VAPTAAAEKPDHSPLQVGNWWQYAEHGIGLDPTPNAPSYGQVAQHGTWTTAIAAERTIEGTEYMGLVGDLEVRRASGDDKLWVRKEGSQVVAWREGRESVFLDFATPIGGTCEAIFGGDPAVRGDPDALLSGVLGLFCDPFQGLGEPVWISFGDCCEVDVNGFYYPGIGPAVMVVYASVAGGPGAGAGVYVRQRAPVGGQGLSFSAVLTAIEATSWGAAKQPQGLGHTRSAR
jgi:hypothetical protein